MAKVLIVGVEKLTMAELDAIIKRFKRYDVSVTRHELTNINWSKMVDQLKEHTHLVLVLKSKGEEILESDKRKVEEITNLIDSDDLPIEMSAIFLDKESVEVYRYLMDDGYCEAAVASSPTINSLLSRNVRCYMTADFIKTPGEVVRAVLGAKAVAA